MKKKLLLALFCCNCLIAAAQTIVVDTVSMGKEYVNQVWYSLSDDEKGAQAKNNWDLGFRTIAGKTPSILVNHSGGSITSVTFWKYPKAARKGWKTVDTAGLSKWPAQYNAETEWLGALGRYKDPTDSYDYGWGIKDVGTDYIIGDSIYIIKTQAGNFKKLLIDKLGGSVYTFTYANLDGTDSTTSALPMIAYSNKNFGYFSLDKKMPVDREPAAADWDLVFGQYATADLAATSGVQGYLVTGALANEGVSIVRAKVFPAARATYKTYSGATFSEDINTIGYKWKSLAGVVNDSFVYFVRRKNGEIWKVNFTGWTNGLSGNGNSVFTKERLATASINENAKTNLRLALSPNPAAYGQQINLVYDIKMALKTAIVTLTDLSGRVIKTDNLAKTPGMHVYSLEANIMPAGMYFVTVIADNESVHQQLIIQ